MRQAGPVHQRKKGAGGRRAVRKEYILCWQASQLLGSNAACLRDISSCAQINIVFSVYCIYR